MNNPEWLDRLAPEPDAQPEYPVDGVYEQRLVRLARRTIVDRLARRPARPYTVGTLRDDAARELLAWDLLVRRWPFARMPWGWPSQDEVEGVRGELHRVMRVVRGMAADDAELIEQVGARLEYLRGRRPHGVVILVRVCRDAIVGVR